ncbi:uncharacterized protein FOMMEDRAFT_159025 [Fomitiporia mediterranea MF3/22]|uniref:uncharacterized protein n=1 Tax=Fomitiporia mediterranea (strain MF3/22) TaxID=694068 RepID=UPI00044083C2|nr:uncharacterized protein FOMMEDRAFT_159025 [Fomitiporia mediterranea MF3/22]EJD00352.1 hypothetical protein FOMMEDRAFT_159025 [Fomitiporia mediterranea MF3/22]
MPRSRSPSVHHSEPPSPQLPPADLHPQPIRPGPHELRFRSADGNTFPSLELAIPRGEKTW